jgi:hypothetical protein
VTAGQTESAVPEPAPTPTSAPTPSPTTAATPTLDLPEIAIPPDFDGEGFLVRFHPDGGLFVGDLISIEVISPPDIHLDNQEMRVIFSDGVEQQVAVRPFRGFGIGGRQQATFQWVLDTSLLAPGPQQITFVITPEGGGEVLYEWEETIQLQPMDQRAWPEPVAAWSRAESDCCLVYFVTGTAAERDLEMLLAIADQEAESAVEQMGGNFDEPIVIVFLPRVLGHGGFASGEIYISYLDRNYAGNNPAQVIHHEMIHILDRRAGGEIKPSIFTEGLAVLLSGGHFKKEPILARAAAVLEAGQYLPLEPLANDFYFQQHEISYLQAAALIQYMSETWGFAEFEDFYRSIIADPENPAVSAAIDRALNRDFGVSLAALDTDFQAYLAAQPFDPDAAEDVRLSVAFFDTVRRYQQAFDPSAYFLTAWLLDIDELLEDGITADYVRHPAEPENLALETLLVAADQALRAGDFEATEELLETVNLVLDGVEEARTDAFYANAVAGDHFAIVLEIVDLGYVPEKIEVDGESARAWVNNGALELLEIEFARDESGWNWVGPGLE